LVRLAPDREVARMISTRPVVFCLVVLLAAALSAFAGERDPLKDVKARMEVEAQKLEKEFSQQRAAAYKLVRRDDPKLVDALDKVHTLLASVRADTALKPARREQLIVTLEWDLGKLKEIAAERRGVSRRDTAVASSVRSDVRRADTARRSEDSKGRVREAETIYDRRAKALADARDHRSKYADRNTRVMRDVDESSTPDSRNMTFPKDWVEKSKKRSEGIKMTAKEQAILKVLSSPMEAEFNNATFGDVIDYLRKKLKVDITVDKRALTELNISESDTTISLKMRSSVRTILKRLLADLNMTYVVKDETILITSQARAKEMTTTRTYYLGDLVAVLDVRLDPVTSYLLMAQRANQLINMITSSIDPQSWKVNNPDAVGTIVFDPRTMAVVVKQTAEVHFMMAGK
jgi:hypothetical protein